MALEDSTVVNETESADTTSPLAGCPFWVTVTPDRDNFEHDLFTEQRIYALIGPRDVKLALAYDFVRDMGFIDIMFILGSDNTRINFEKLTTKDIDGAKNKQDFYRKAKTVKVEEI